MSAVITDQPTVSPSRKPLSTRRTNRREFIVVSGGSMAAVAIFGLNACGGGGGKASGEVLLSISPDLKDIVTKQVARFNNQQGADGVKATTRIMPSDTQAYFDQLRTQFQGGGTDIDLIAGDVSWPAQLAANGFIADLSSRFNEDERKKYLPGAIAGDTFQGKIYGLPMFTDVGLLYYRSDLLEKSGFSAAPATWDELKQMAAKVQKDAGVQNGFLFTGAQYEGGTVLGTEFVRTAGGDILDGDQVVITSPEAVAGLTNQRSLVAEGISPEAVANFQEDQATGAFLRGDAVFMRMWPYAYDFISDPKQSSIQESQVGLAQVPVASPDVKQTNVGGGWSFYVNADANDQDAAWELAQYLAAPEQQKERALEGSYLPTRTEVYDDPEVIKALPAVRLGRDAIENTTTPPVSPYYADMSLVMAEKFNANILGDVEPQQAAEQIKEQLDSIISRGG